MVVFQCVLVTIAFFLCLIAISVSLYCHCRHTTILCIHQICKLCRGACRSSCLWEVHCIAIREKKNKKKVFGLVKVTHALALRSSSKQLAVVSVFRALPFYVFSSYGPQSSWFKVHRLEPLTWVPEILFSGRALFPIYFCVHTCTLLLLHTGSMRLAFVTLGI